ncbi:hypothetical protein KXW69_000770, partial [Aspergillus fumigatus]
MPLSVIRLTKQLRALNNDPGLLPTRESYHHHVRMNRALNPQGGHPTSRIFKL